jgi:uncharacterized coiled-coil DUF342 family protein
VSEKRDAFVQKIKARIDEWNAEIDRLKAKAEQAEADARIEYHDEIQELKNYRDDARKKLDKLQNAGEGAWEDLKAGVEMAFDAMNQAVSSARNRFK